MKPLFGVQSDNFIFVGRRIQRQEDGSYTIDQIHYMAELYTAKIIDDLYMDHKALTTEFRSELMVECHSCHQLEGFGI